MKHLTFLVVLFFCSVANAQSDLSKNYQLSLIGLREAESREQSSQIAVVVSNRIVIRHYQSAPQQIRQLRQTFGGGQCGCGK